MITVVTVVAVTGCTAGAAQHAGPCGYQLAPTGPGYLLTGEADAHNTSNSAAVFVVTFSWAQHGTAPLETSRKVAVGPGQTMVIPLSRRVTDTQVARLQMWRVRHSHREGCTYTTRMAR